METPTIYNLMESRLRDINPDVIIGTNTFRLFDDHINLCINSKKGTEKLLSPNRAILYQLIRMGFDEEVISKNHELTAYTYSLRIKSNGAFSRDSFEDSKLKPFNAKRFSDNFEKMALFLTVPNLVTIQLNERNQLFAKLGLLDDSGRYNDQYRYLKNFFEKQVDIRKSHPHTFQRSAFTLAASKDSPTLSPSEIADRYNSHKNKFRTKFARALTGFYYRITGSPIRVDDNVDLAYQYVTNIQKEARCLTNGRTMEQIMNPGRSIDDQVLPFAYPCTSCTIFNRENGIGCGITAIGAKEANRWNWEVAKHDWNGLKISGADLIVDKLIQGGFIRQ